MTARIRCVAAAMLVALGTLAEAQVVRGRVLADGGEPARGAIVSLLDDGDRRLAPALVDEGGAYVVTAPRAGTFRLRVDLIGYRSWLSEPIVLSAGDATTRDVRLPLARAELPTVSVSGQTSCEAHPEQVPRLLAIWEEIRRALTINEIAERRGLVPVELTVVREDRVGARWDVPVAAPPRPVERTTPVLTRGRNGATVVVEPPRPTPAPPTTTNVPGRVVRREQGRLRSVGARPWKTRSPADLAEHGYVRVVDGAQEYAGIDAPILLSSEFVATHCFRPVRKNALFGGDAVGLAFEPAPGRTLPEVKGTLWLDAKSSELRRVEFELVNLPPTSTKVSAPRGTLDFARLPAGAWYVRQWTMEQETQVRGAPVRRKAQGTATPLRRTGNASAVARLAGVVVDSTMGDALGGATIYVPGLEPVVTDSAGRFAVTVADLPDDSLELFVRIDHPRLAALGLSSMEQSVRLYPGRDASLAAGIPSPATLAAALCPVDGTPGEPGAARDAGLLLGRAVRADGSAAAAGTRVVVEWPSDERLGQGVAARNVQRGATVEEDGRFRVCAVPTGRSLRLKVDGARGDAVEVVVPSTGIAQVELSADP